MTADTQMITNNRFNLIHHTLFIYFGNFNCTYNQQKKERLFLLHTVYMKKHFVYTHAHIHIMLNKFLAHKKIIFFTLNPKQNKFSEYKNITLKNFILSHHQKHLPSINIYKILNNNNIMFIILYYGI